VKKGLVQTLAGKYPSLFRYSPDPMYCEFGDKTNSVTLQDKGYPLGLELSYKNTPLNDAVVSDQIKIEEEEKIRKEQGIKDSLRGL
jgi:hypothetical protein